MRSLVSRVLPSELWRRRTSRLAIAGVLLFANSSEMGHLATTSELSDEPPIPAPAGVTGGGTLYLEPPPPVRLDPPPPPPASGEKPARPVRPTQLDGLGIPATVLDAYRKSARRLRTSDPRCHLPVALLAAIGRVESYHARRGNVDAHGTTLAPILGPRLDGRPGLAAIRDTDNGRYDGDRAWDRAVGAMQFIPGTWKRWGTDGNNDGAANPHNVYDATAAAGRYLCAGQRDLRRADDLRSAILSYNDSNRYLSIVLAWMRLYSGRTAAVPDQRSAPRPGEPATQPSPSASDGPVRGGDSGSSRRSDPVPSGKGSPQPPAGTVPTQQPTPPPALPSAPTSQALVPGAPEPKTSLQDVAGEAAP